MRKPIEVFDALTLLNFSWFQVPRVFIGGKFIGGGNETAELHRNKELGKMLKRVGAIL